MKKAAFLDRDGVLNRNPEVHDYVKKVEELEMLAGAREGVEKLKKGGYVVVVVSNQRGVAWGMMTAEAVEDINREVSRKLGEKVDAWYWCGHMGNEPGCDCRKPKPGLVLRAARELGIDLKKSVVIGDSKSDRECAAAAGVRFVEMKRDGSLKEVVEKELGL